MKLLFLASSLLVAAQLSMSQDTIRVMTYNLLNYSPPDYSRDQYYRTVIQAANPDILVVQEIDTPEAVQNFLINVLNPGGSNVYSAGDFVDGTYDSENALFYKTGKLSFVSNNRIITDLRDINRFTVDHVSSERSFAIFSVHLKAGREPATQLLEADSVRRAMEVDSLRKVTNAFPNGTDFIVLGDFNIYHPFEPAYEKLVTVIAGNEGHFIDPLTMTGVWNDSGYAPYHTQSTRVRSFGYGATGGLDDRFDMILMSKAVSESGGISLIPASYHAFGNDGQHYNDSINQLPNAAVADSIANALHYASDHLPVVADFVFDPLVAVEKKAAALEFRLFQNYPNPFNPMTEIRYQMSEVRRVKLSVYDILGREVAVLMDEERGPGVHEVFWDASSFPSRMYFYQIRAGEYLETRKMVLMK